MLNFSLYTSEQHMPPKENPAKKLKTSTLRIKRDTTIVASRHHYGDFFNKSGGHPIFRRIDSKAN